MAGKKKARPKRKGKGKQKNPAPVQLPPQEQGGGVGPPSLPPQQEAAPSSQQQAPPQESGGGVKEPPHQHTPATTLPLPPPPLQTPATTPPPAPPQQPTTTDAAMPLQPPPTQQQQQKKPQIQADGAEAVGDDKMRRPANKQSREDGTPGPTNPTWIEVSPAFRAKVEYFLLALQARPETEETELEARKRKARVGRLADAIASKNSDSPLARHIAGCGQAKLGDNDRAVRHLLLAVDRQPNCVGIGLSLASVHEDMQRFDLAAAECRRALAITSPCDPALYTLHPPPNDLDFSASAMLHRIDMLKKKLELLLARVEACAVKPPQQTPVTTSLLPQPEEQQAPPEERGGGVMEPLQQQTPPPLPPQQQQQTAVAAMPPQQQKPQNQADRSEEVGDENVQQSESTNRTWTKMSPTFRLETEKLFDALTCDRKAETDEAKKVKAKAGRLADRIASRYRNSPLAKHLAGCVQAEGGDNDRALMHLLLAADLQPHCVGIALSLATVRESMQEFGLAAEECRRALALTTPCDPALYAMRPPGEDFDFSIPAMLQRFDLVKKQIEDVMARVVPLHQEWKRNNLVTSASITDCPQQPGTPPPETCPPPENTETKDM